MIDAIAINRAQREFTELESVIRRHRPSEGFCRCCSQPWPCDLARVVLRITGLMEES